MEKSARTEYNAVHVYDQIGNFQEVLDVLGIIPKLRVVHCILTNVLSLMLCLKGEEGREEESSRENNIVKELLSSLFRCF